MVLGQIKASIETLDNSSVIFLFRRCLMSEFTILAIIKQLLDKLTIDAVERILAYMTIYLEQRVNYEEMEGSENVQ